MRLIVILTLGLAAVACPWRSSARRGLRSTRGNIWQAIAAPASAPGEVLWTIRAPRAVAAAFVGAALGLAGAVMQGLLLQPARRSRRAGRVGPVGAGRPPG